MSTRELSSAPDRPAVAERPAPMGPSWRMPAAIALSYLLISAVWIIFSDHAFHWFSHDLKDMQQYQTWKGLGFVCFTALLLFLTLRYWQRRLRRAFNWLSLSETGYRTMFEDNPNPMCIYDPGNLEILQVNATMARQFGYDADRLRGMSVRDLMPVEEADALQRAVLNEHQHQASQFDQLTFVRRDGSRLFCQTSAYPLLFEGRPARIVLLVDVSSRVAMEAALTGETERLHAAHRIARLGDFQYRIEDDRLSGSPEFWRLLNAGDGPVSASPDAMFELFPEPDRSALASAWLRLVSDGRPLELHLRVVDPAGRWRHLQMRAERLAQDHDAPGLAGTLMDISEQQQLLQQVIEREARFTELAAHIPEVFWSYDHRQGQTTYISPAFEQIWGQPLGPPGETSERWRAAIVEDDRAAVQACLRSVAETREAAEVEYRIHRPDGAEIRVQDRAFPIIDAQGELLRVIGITVDVTEQRWRQDELYHAAHYDTLSGLPNRKLFMERLRQQCHDSTERGTQFALLYIDLDRFKNVNDSLGHGAGDELLRQLADRLQQRLGRRGFLARLGGDEFAILAARTTDQSALDTLSAALLATFNLPFEVYGQMSYVTGSIGIACFPEHGDDPETLLKNADMAMYAAKAQGRNQCAYFRRENAAASPDRLRLESEMHLALDRGEFELFYQGQFDSHSLRLAGVECLLRWRHPQQGLVSPAHFIPLLEESGLILKVGDWVLQEACRVQKRWQDMGYGGISLAVNISARQVNQAGLADRVAALLAEYALPPGALELELTESSIMREPARAGQLFDQLRAMGARIAIDDFGTGYSNLAYLKRFAPHVLKIDKSFIDDIHRDRRTLDIVAGIIHLAHVLDTTVVAEGVETAEQLAHLRDVDCDLIQGYLLSRPLPLSGFEYLLAGGPINYTDP